MTEQEIQKAFEGRWRIKQQALYEPPIILPEHVRALCLDFFQAGILIGEGFLVGEICDEKGQSTGQTVIYKHDPIFDAVDSGFSEWWDLYDKKRGRKKCLKKWEKLTDADRRACIKATPAYVASTPDIQFRKDPLTYLNGECWNDQIIMNHGTDKQAQQQQHFAEVAERIAEYTKEPR